MTKPLEKYESVKALLSLSLHASVLTGVRLLLFVYSEQKSNKKELGRRRAIQEMYKMERKLTDKWRSGHQNWEIGNLDITE